MSFVLAAAPDLPPSQPLHLLPFALSPTPRTAAVGTYFVPRPGPAGSLAAFRGRRVVGQDIGVPRGYRGVVLRAAAPPSSTATDAATAFAREPTAAAQNGSETVAGVERVVGRVTRAMQKGAAQVALARPRAVRRARKVQKFALDEGEEEAPPVKRVKVEATTAVNVEAEAEAGAGAEIGVETETEVEMEMETQVSRAATPPLVPAINVVPSSPAPGFGGDGDEDMAREVDLAAVSAVLTPEPEIDPEVSGLASEEHTALRVLTPTATFSSFTLWTPDAPLAGFRADEVEVEGHWRQGGAGEGGDAFVRALGEWLGLNEIIHAPMYDTDDDE
ncbi:hypothetical protein CC85DRAFT_328529 [Cutaneotrichosporon oleaginosum]|uniref:Uncharacterized protein n=1 Tax=Cutaneotrichosporon oleaginosum TaxID=879819 RepID=A0A0J0XLI8_9TREE|nr:uncharacterized protein CC85DRAFT_328529 [Cutaneotrichosporon oleaginosum]KLT41962.1 hypothetical protein CC85DRAFT_328529 [Cutaneotrichosporon oleaginosum]TXT14377.1 hypothetical protein COLE_00570 [Cutaneotrichosporon oleaginosum]